MHVSVYIRWRRQNRRRGPRRKKVVHGGHFCTKLGAGRQILAPRGPWPGPRFDPPKRGGFPSRKLVFDPPNWSILGPGGKFLVLHRYTSTYVKHVHFHEKVLRKNTTD